jgi:predicted kinase
MPAAVNRPTLFLTVGLPGTGKTTAARRLEAEHDALRLTKDEWVKGLFGDENPAWASDVIEGRLIQIARRSLELGISVVLDFGLWSRDERSALRRAAAEAGAAVEMRFFDLTGEEQRRRLDQRLADAPHSTWPISRPELDEWASRFEAPTRGELDGTDPIGDPPEGFDTWAAWTAHRWPLATPTGRR